MMMTLSELVMEQLNEEVYPCPFGLIINLVDWL